MNNEIVIIYGSPRSLGNSDKLGQAFAKGAMENGNRVYEFYIRNMNINGCTGCEYCYSHPGECVQKDDMQEIHKKLYNAEILVFSTPIYYQSFPSQLKAVVDRLFISENKKFLINKSILFATYATPDKKMERMTKKYFETLCEYHGWKILDELLVSGLDEKDDILNNQDALLIAYNLGKNIK